MGTVSNDAEHLVEVINGKRFFKGKYLPPSFMLWKCVTPECPSPPKPQNRGQYKDKTLCVGCANRLKCSDPDFLARRGKTISAAVLALGPMRSDLTKKFMANLEIRAKCMAGITAYVNDKSPETMEKKRLATLKGNIKCGFGTKEYLDYHRSRMTPETKKAKSLATARFHTIKGREEHIELMKERVPNFEILEFGRPDNTYLCPNKHTFLMRGNNFLRYKICPRCTTRSRPQLELFEWVRTLLPNVDQNRKVLYLDETRSGRKALEIDIYDKESSFGVEVHGIYHHQERFCGKLHQRKAELATQHGIRLLQFFDDEILGRNKIVKSIIKAKLGIGAIPINGRDCEAVILGVKESRPFLNEYHLQGNCNSSIKIGLKHKGRLISVLTFRKFNNQTNKKHGSEKTQRDKYRNKHIIEIARFCTLPDIRIRGGFSKMLKKAESLLKKAGYTQIATYSDRRYSSGDVYAKNGFKFIYFTKPDMFWVKKNVRYPRQISFGKTTEEMYNNKYYKILGAGSAFWMRTIP